VGVRIVTIYIQIYRSIESYEKKILPILITIAPFTMVSLPHKWQASGRGGKSGGERETHFYLSICGAVVELRCHDQKVFGSNPVKVLFIQFSFDLTKYMG
jgi:hypothetical protein